MTSITEKGTAKFLRKSCRRCFAGTSPVRSQSPDYFGIKKWYRFDERIDTEYRKKESARTFFLPKTSNGVRRMNRAALAFFCAFFFLPHLAAAQVVISEVMYDLEGADTDREWVEVFNSGSSAILLTEWKLFEANSNHNIVAHSGGESLSGGAYAVIADNPVKFLEDRPGYTGLLFDSAFSLSNTGETLTLRCCGTGENLSDKDPISYDPGTGAAGDGNSLHRTSTSGASFLAGAATPGTGNLQKTVNASPSGSPSEPEEDTISTPSSTDSSTSGSISGGSAILARVSAGTNRPGFAR